MGQRRLLRVADLLREEIDELLRRQVHDPRVAEQDFTILRVEVTPDLSRAHVHVSTLLEGAARDALLAGMQSAAGFMHRELARRVRLKHTPELLFAYDGGLAHGQHITNLLNTLREPAS